MSLKLKIGLASVLVLLVLGVFIFWRTHPVKSKFPLDQNLITLFTAKHDVFEKLRKMADEDWGKQATFSVSDSSSKLAESRQQEYHDLLLQIGSGVIERRDYNGTITFNLAGEGVAIGPTWGKGIMYIPGSSEKEGIVVQNLDDVSKLAPGVYLRPIEPNWFIFYQQTD
jgi:hypothetical protein